MKRHAAASVSALIAAAAFFTMTAESSGPSQLRHGTGDVEPEQIARARRSPPRQIGLMPVVLKSEWPKPVPRQRRSPGGASDLTVRATPTSDAPLVPSGDIDEAPLTARTPRHALTLGPALPAGVTVYTPPIAGRDPMIAVGHQFMIASQNGSLVFLDKNGVSLPAEHGVSATPSVSAIFGDFVDRDSPTDLNKWSGFTMPCDSTDYPQTRTGKRYCIAEFYDLRAYHDSGADRFILLAQVRNALWTDIWAGRKTYQKEYRACGVYALSEGNVPVPDPAHCELTRRHAVFAVSRTADPRDGFYTYAITENNVQDWPWGAVNPGANTFVVGHKGVEMSHGMAAMVFRLSDLRNGARSPSYFKLYAKDLNGRLNPAPVVNQIAAPHAGLTLLAASSDGSDGDVLEVFAFQAPGGQGIKPPILRTARTLTGIDLPGWMARSVFRGGYLYMAWEADDPSDSYDTLRVRTLRTTLSMSRDFLSLGNMRAPTYRSAWLGKTGSGSWEVDDSHPAIAVNGAGDVLVAFSRARGEQLLYVIWRKYDPAPSPEIVVRARAKPDFQNPLKIDYAWAVVDPVADPAGKHPFWFAHVAKKPDGSAETAVVRVAQ